jgi:hypothetical protein
MLPAGAEPDAEREMVDPVKASEIQNVYYNWRLTRDYASKQYNWKINSFNAQTILALI